MSFNYCPSTLVVSGDVTFSAVCSDTWMLDVLTPHLCVTEPFIVAETISISRYLSKRYAANRFLSKYPFFTSMFFMLS